MFYVLLFIVSPISIGAAEILDPPKAPPLDQIVPLDFKPDLMKDLEGVRSREHIALGNGSAMPLKGYGKIQPWWIYKTWDGGVPNDALIRGCLLYTSDAADE